MRNYITGNSTSNFKWDQLVAYLEEAIKRHATIGSTVTVYHHLQGYLGTVRKMRNQSAFWQPIGVATSIPGVKVPDNWVLSPTEEQIDAVVLKGWETLRDKVIGMFTKEKKQMPTKEQWIRWAIAKNGKVRW